MPSFSHSGTTGDTFSSCVAVKVLGGGDFYLKLRNLENILPPGWTNKGTRHEGRMTEEDYEIMREFILHQPYINSFKPWNGEHIDYELEKAAQHLETNRFPRNFANQYAKSQGIDMDKYYQQLQVEPYMECREPRRFPGRPIVVNRTPHYQNGNETNSPMWREFIQEHDIQNYGVFVGLENEHAWFEDTFKIRVPHYRTPDYMELARVISGSELFICSMSSPCATALALGANMWVETRKNEPFERLEINFPGRTNIRYF
jgi:hypothetical protein